MNLPDRLERGIVKYRAFQNPLNLSFDFISIHTAGEGAADKDANAASHEGSNGDQSVFEGPQHADMCEAPGAVGTKGQT
jgi:hypothetical protein